VPSQPLLNHLQVDVPVAQVNVAENPSVPILLFPGHDDFFFADQLAHFIFGLRPERLPLLRAVDSFEANLVLNLLGIENCDRVAVSNAHDLPTNLLGMKRGGDEQEQ